MVKITPVWDFSGYNSITTESIDDRMEYYIDNSHYSLKAGDLVLNRIVSFQTEKVPRDFGVLVNQDNIEPHLEQNSFRSRSLARKASRGIKFS